jgi:hypothetical protein
MPVFFLFTQIREQKTNAYYPRIDSSFKVTLQNEISVLRRRMEQLVQEEDSFTSEMVIQLSMLLDEKINEYNDFLEKNRRKQS